MTVTEPSAPADMKESPISLERLVICRDSAAYWSSERTGLLSFSRSMQTRANFFAIAAALLATVTSLTIWTTLTGKPGWGAQLAVSIVALIGAALAAFPRITNYAETAGKARELGSQYGALLGRFTDAIVYYDDPAYMPQIRQLVRDFESVKVRKDQLVPYPKAQQQERDRLRDLEAKKDLDTRRHPVVHFAKAA